MTQAELNTFLKILEARMIQLDHSTRRRDVITIEETADILDRRLRAAEREFAVRSLEAGSAKLREARDALIEWRMAPMESAWNASKPSALHGWLRYRGLRYASAARK